MGAKAVKTKAGDKKDTPAVAVPTKKGDKKDTPGAETPKIKAKTKGTPSADTPAPKNDTPVLFGGWTGKTPVTLLNEYVQRQDGWHRASYNVRSTGGRHSCVIHLAKEDKKLGRLQVEYRPTATASTGLHFATAVEARHMAATYALYQLRGNTSLHRMMPPVHRAYWLDLDTEKTPGRDFEDPFITKVAKDRDRADRQKAAEKREETRARARETGRHEDLLPAGLRTRWDALSAVPMSEPLRAQAEGIVRTWTATWGLSSGTDGDGGGLQGFRAAHVDEALAACAGDRAAAFEWLCVHVPEDDLPDRVMRRGYKASLVTGSNAAAGDELARGLAAKRVARSGFALSMCRDAIDEALNEDQANGDLAWAEARAADVLVARLCQRPVPVRVPGAAVVDDEVDALESIYAGEARVTRPSPFRVSVGIRPSDATLCPADATLEFWLPDASYPDARTPSVTLASDHLPAHLKLHVARTLDALLPRDMPVFFDAVSIADDRIEEWLAHPPPLAHLMRGIAQETAPQMMQGSSEKKTRRGDRNPLGPRDWARAVDAFARAQSDPAYQRMQQGRKLLPAAQMEALLVELVRGNRCVVVAGATGCGKTTQVPQFILDWGLRANQETSIVCTQPRRISALGVAARVAEERGSPVGAAVGYAVRGESRRSHDTRLLFCTTGVLLRMISEDPTLRGTTHVVCDEVHERSVDSDLLLVLLLQSMKMNPRLKVVLMSATAQSDRFATYFDKSTPVVDIPGRTFPVDDVFVEDFAAQISNKELAAVFGPGWQDAAQRRWDTMASRSDSDDSAREWMTRATALAPSNPSLASALAAWEDRNAAPHHVDYALAAAIVRHIHATADRGLSILVFMPGVAEISATVAALKPIDGLTVLPLHAGLSPAEQRRVFQSTPGRKVVVATNIAETSITIDDIGFVVDAGRVRELRHDHATRVARLTTALCSQAAAAQRRGRAGRTRPGVCFRMYTRHTHGAMPPHADPEILRSPLEQVALRIKALGHVDPRAILDAMLDPPPPPAIAAAESLLVAVGACLESGALTALGRFVADIPVDLRLAKMLVYGALLGALDDALKLVAVMALDRPMFVGDRDAVRAARCRFSANGLSDWLADVAAFDWLAESPGGAKPQDICVAPAAIRDIKATMRQLRDALRATGLVEESRKPSSPLVLKALVCAGLVPNIVRVRMPPQKFTQLIGGTISKDHEAREVSFYAPASSTPAPWQTYDYHGDRRVFIHPQSTLFAETKFPAPFLVYFAQSMSATGQKTFLRDATVPGIYALLMFGPAPLIIDHENRVLSLASGALSVRAWPRIAVLVTQLRALLDELLRRKLDDPDSVSLSAHPVVQTVLQLIETDGQ
ncbi:helicase [Coemansia sp. 'formosensis']|nr:helicase [Coemansia sp. 'formosensis']